MLTTTKKALLIGNVKAYSAAQAITLIAYGDSNKGEKAGIPFRCLHIKTECENYNDFEECIKIIESYNEFDAEEMIPNLRKYLDLKKYYNANNGNNGNSFFKFEIGREGSPAFYVSFMPNWDKNTYNGENITPYSLEQFKEDMKLLQILLKADEMDIEEEYKVTARFWFD